MKVAVLTTDSREHFKTYGAPAPFFGTAPEALFQGFRSHEEVEIHVISCVQRPVASPEKIAPNIWYHSLFVPRLGWGRTAYQGCIRAVRKKLRQLQPEIVHGQGTEKDCALSAVLSGFPGVVTIHGNMAELARLFRARFGSYQWLAARLENFALKRSAGVFCNSEYTEQLVKPRATRTWRVPNALRLDFFAPLQRAERPRQATLLNVGVITPRKRQIQLLDLAEELNRRGLAFQFVFVGEVQAGDPYGARFLERIKPMETAGFARYLGTREVDELVRLFDQSSALVHFPLEESFGLTVAEALARNLKLFGSHAGGLIDICRDAPGAELFDPHDWASLAEAIAAWLGQGAPQPDGAGALMRSRYHPEVIAARHLEIYREVLRLPA